jgi:hypothetical protein
MARGVGPRAADRGAGASWRDPCVRRALDWPADARRRGREPGCPAGPAPARLPPALVGVAQGHPAARRALPRVRAPTCAALAGRTRRPTGTPWTRFSPTCARCSTRSRSGGSGSSPTTSVHSSGSGSASTTRNVSRPFVPRPATYLRFKPQMLTGIPQLWFQPVVATPGWPVGPAHRPARPPPAGRSTTTPDSITDEDLVVFTGRLHAQGHPEAGAPYRNLILPEIGRFMAATSKASSGGSQSRPSRSWAALMPASSGHARRLRRPSGRPQPATSSTTRHIPRR